MRWLIVTLLVSGCGKRDVADSPRCEDTATVVQLDEVTPLGFAASDLTPWAVGTHETALTWERDGTTTPLTVEVGEPTEARYVDRVAVYPDGGEHLDMGIECPNRVEMDVALGFTTGDGAFDEHGAATLTATVSERLELWHELDPDALSGTYDMDDDITEPDWEDRWLALDGAFDDAGARGDVRGQVWGEEECEGNECASWAAEVDIATWGPEDT